MATKTVLVESRGSRGCPKLFWAVFDQKRKILFLVPILKIGNKPRRIQFRFPRPICKKQTRCEAVITKKEPEVLIGLKLGTCPTLVQIGGGGAKIGVLNEPL